MLFDSHVHSKISFDSETEPQDAIAAAEALGIGLVFTEHLDYYLPGLGDKFVANVPLYLDTYTPLKTPRVLTGLEIGLAPSVISKNAAIAADKRLDFIIGSAHTAAGRDVAMPDFWENNKEPKRVYLEYLIDMAETNDFFDSLGHIDYPSRYCPYADNEIRYPDYKTLYDKLFDTLIKTSRALELNTARLGGEYRGASHPEARSVLGEIFTAYAACGGRLVTIGSDAHKPYEIGKNFAIAAELLGDLGLEPVYYKGRTPYKCAEFGQDRA